jgi:Asp-tRNA(Asn)/Glu-tRNA(Gln) amidotransferase A subunit family amidase
MQTNFPRYDPKQSRLLTFRDAVRRFRDATDSPRGYLERCLQVIEAREPEVQAFVVLNIEGARKAADASTARYRAGAPLSRVDGLPIGIKDLYETADMPTQMGSALFKDWRSGRDAAAVHALRQGGAIIVGKTVTTEFGFYNPGPTRNPFDPARTPGGSSSGSAAAVGAAMLPAAIGSQVVGSLIRPAGYCANVGFKPTFGALNRGGGGTGLSQACIGVHAGSIEDSWAVSHHIAAFAGGDPGHPGLFGAPDVPAPAKPARLIRLETAGWPQCDDATRGRFEDALARLSRQGVSVLSRKDDPKIAEFEAAIAEAKQVTDTLCGYELRWPLTIYRDRGPHALSDNIAARLKVWEQLTVEQYRAALARREALRRMHAALKELAPAQLTLSSAGAAPRGLGNTGDPVFAIPGSLLGAPAMSLPLLETEGMPLGLQLLGYPHGDADLHGLARWISTALLAA